MTSDDAAPPVLTRIEGDVAQVVLNRPEKLNGITLEMLDALIEAARSLQDRTELRAVVISGAGRSFCAGLDLAAVMPDQDGIRRAFSPLPAGPASPAGETNAFQEACWAWRRLDLPVIAVVRGHCLGGGLQIALGADFRFTAPDAQWSVLEGKWGLIPDMSGIQALSEQVGKDTAKLLMMTAEFVDGTRAAELGLATAAAPDPDAAAADLIATLRRRSPDAVAAAKRAVEQSWEESPAATFGVERHLQGQLLGAANTRVAQQAGLSGQDPTYAPRGPLR